MSVKINNPSVTNTVGLSSTVVPLVGVPFSCCGFYYINTAQADITDLFQLNSVAFGYGHQIATTVNGQTLTYSYGGTLEITADKLNLKTWYFIALSTYFVGASNAYARLFWKAMGAPSCKSLGATISTSGSNFVPTTFAIGFDKQGGDSGMIGNACGVRTWLNALNQDEFEAESQQFEEPVRTADLLYSWPLPGNTNLQSYAPQQNLLTGNTPGSITTSYTPQIPGFRQKHRMLVPAPAAVTVDPIFFGMDAE